MRTLLLFVFCLATWPASATNLPGGDFTLRSSQGDEVTLTSLRGKVVLLFFGFTSCPEICPTELAQFGQVLAKLPADKRQWVQPVFVSVDPKRDTPAVLAAYVGHFGKQILALTGSEEQLRKVAEQYGASFRYVPNGTDYSVDHSVNTYLIDQNGKLVRILPYGTPGSELLRLVLGLLPK